MNTAASSIDPKRLQRLEEASDWLLRLQEPTRTEEDLNEWLRWCDADPDNFAALETVQRKWQDLDALKGEPSSSLPQQATNQQLVSVRATRARDRARRIMFAIAAGLAAIALGALLQRELATAFRSTPRQVTAAQADRATTLPDGSEIILGARSVLSMDFTGPTRQLDLSSGKAYFKVKHDAARPFVVQAGGVSVTAIGTAFDVRRRRDKVTVTVEEGTVKVQGAATGGGDAPVWRAEAGYQLTYSTKERTASLASVDPASALTWRSGELAYVHEPLGSVVEDLNRYSSRRIVVADPAVAQIPFTGTAWVNSLDDWLAAVQQAYPVDVSESANGEVVLHSRQ